VISKTSQGAERLCPKCQARILQDQEACGACLLENGLLDPGDLSPAEIQTSFGDYELLEELARGGQGVVYRARHKTLNRIVALKMVGLGSWATEASLKRFKIEAEAAANLDDPRIVPIYEVGDVEGQHYFTMKLIEGQSLKQLAASGPLPVRRAAEIVVSVGGAIHHAHERGILHRDIKPGNILLDSQGQPHVTDFGLAKLVEGDSTVTNTMDVLGTPSYMSPEQAAGRTKELTSGTDVYGLGAVLYHLLTGNPPFAGDTTWETIRQVLDKEPRPLRLWNPKVDRDLETICLKCLEKEPAKRYASALALADDLERWLRDEPIQARPSGVFSRGRKWARRNPFKALFIPAAAALVLAVGIIFWQARPSAPAANAIAVVLRPGDAGSKFLSTEFARDLTHVLSRMSALKVTPRSQVLRWEGSTVEPETMGKDLRVPMLLLGTVQHAAEKFTFNMELVRVADGVRLWRKSFEAKHSEGASVQSQIARAVVSTLRVELNEKERALLRRPLTSNQEAWVHYALGRQHLDKMSEAAGLNAIEEFEQAIRHDPEFAQAYAGLADAHIQLGYNFQKPEPHFRKAHSHIKAALLRDETLPEAKIAEGVLKCFLDWDWPGSEHAVRQALQLDPSAVESNACYLHLLDVMGRPEEALLLVQNALRFHPSSVAIQAEVGCAAYYAGQFERAIATYHQTIENDPENPFLYWGLGRCLAQQGKLDEAAAALEKGKSKPGGEWSGLLSELACVRVKQGRPAEATAFIEQMRQREKSEYVDPYIYAVVYGALGETDEMFRHLELACADKSVWIPSLPVEPKFTPFRNDPRYARLMVRLGLLLQRTPPQDP
jgi:TolB-like protein/predicted Ser/Thr protein kinase